jgi:adenine-specific DNA-methyltransferase
MNYIGSKNKLSSFLKKSIHNVASNDLKDKIFCDIFAGTGAVARSFKTQVKSRAATYAIILINKAIF